MPGFFAPMAATAAETLPKGKNWIFEVKWDGVRALTFISGQTVSIFTRNNNRCDRQYPELQVLPHYIEADQIVLDGEIVVLDPKGISRFELIQPRIHNQDANSISKMSEKNPVHFYCFDLLYLNGYDLRRVPLAERKRALAAVLKPFALLHVSDHFEGVGEELLEAARQTGLEGLIAKCSTGFYESRRSRDWLKVKLTAQQEFVIAGFSPGERDTFGSLVLGYYSEGKLLYAGNVGTGFTERTLRDLIERMRPLVVPGTPLASATGVPKGSVWVRPELIAQIKYANWTGDNKLRAPVYLGLRNDVAAVQVTREEPLFPAGKKEVSLEIDGHTIRFSNLDKVYYPENKYTKRDLLNYYNWVAHLILPHLKDRPLSLKRYPNGIHEEFFFQKNTPENYPAWLSTETIGSEGRPIRYVMAQNRASLLYLTNLGCIDQNPWMSRCASLANPDYILFDLDPYQCGFEKVVEAALLVRDKLDAIGLTGYPKTTGGDGMHIFVPVEPVYGYDQVRLFAEVIARLLAAERPDLFTTPRSVKDREKNKVYFDYLQIAESKTISAPYVARAYPGAPVSAPLAWSEVNSKLRPEDFDILNAPERFARTGDLYAPVLNKPQKIEQAFAKLEKLIRR